MIQNDIFYHTISKMSSYYHVVYRGLPQANRCYSEFNNIFYDFITSHLLISQNSYSHPRAGIFITDSLIIDFAILGSEMDSKKKLLVINGYKLL